jgi:hypothetical protein
LFVLVVVWPEKLRWATPQQQLLSPEAFMFLFL